MLHLIRKQRKRGAYDVLWILAMIGLTLITMGHVEKGIAIAEDVEKIMRLAMAFQLLMVLFKLRKRR